MKAFQQPGYLGGLLGYTAATSAEEVTTFQSRTQTPIAETVDGIGPRQQCLEDPLVISAQGIECLHRLTCAGALALSNGVEPLVRETTLVSGARTRLYRTAVIVPFPQRGVFDPDLVFMTTKVDGGSTQWLPFNRGYLKGAGNPPGAEGNYRTAYLWEEALSRDSLLDILARYIHLQVEQRQVRTPSGVRTIRKEAMIFPRYHQLTSVRKLVAHAGAHGSGHNYLI